MNAFGTRLVNTCQSEGALVTIREVAHKAGFSIGTVSRVLNNKPGVSDKTRRHVLAVAQEMGYVSPKRLPLSTSNVSHLGLLSRPMQGSLTTNPFYAGVFHGVEQICHNFHLSLSFSSLDLVNGRLRSSPALIKDERINGLVLVGALSREVVESLANAVQLPIVLVDNCLPDGRWDTVMTDNPRGAYLATKHLISQGHRRIALLGGPDHPSIVERCAGYKEALEHHNLVPTVVPSKDLELEDGAQAAVELLQRAPETTGIVCSNDLQAIGALKRLQELGYEVPGDFSMVGFDDINLVQFTSPPITTIRVDRQALGQLAAQLLLDRINAPERPAIKTVVGVKLIERASVCAPRRHSIISSAQEGGVNVFPCSSLAQD